MNALIARHTITDDPNPVPGIGPYFDVIAFAASMGGIGALHQILPDLPADLPAAVIIVQHRSIHLPNLLAKVLGQRCPLPVETAIEGSHVAPGKVYVAPSGVHLLVGPDNRFYFSHGEKIRHVRPAADVLFKSVAESYGPRAIGVVLTGGDDDGADGVREIAKHGGIAIAQDVGTAKCDHMPLAAMWTGCVSYVLPLQKIAPTLTTLVTTGACASRFYQKPIDRRGDKQ